MIHFELCFEKKTDWHFLAPYFRLHPLVLFYLFLKNVDSNTRSKTFQKISSILILKVFFLADL